MPSRVRLDHISGPDLDALMRDATSDPAPTWRPARGIGHVFAAPSGRASAVVVMVALAVLLLVAGLRAVQDDGAATSPLDAIATPTATPTVAAYAALPVMVVYCDGARRELMSDREVADLRAVIPDWPRRCFADYGWCAACQIAWQSAHP
jgi:hypothetical protein